MSPSRTIAPLELRDYLKSRGWTLVQDDRIMQRRLYLLQNPDYPLRQLMFPMSIESPDYEEMVTLAVSKIAEIEGREFNDVVRDLLVTSDDCISLRVTDGNASVGSSGIPLTFATSLLSAATNMLLASACTVLRPQRHHPRLSLTNATELLNSSVFRHTQQGSFVLNVSCPVITDNLFEEPFARRATHTLYESLQKIVQAIETDTEAYLVQSLLDTPDPVISSNVCDAIVQMHDATVGNSIDVSFSWSSAIQRPSTQGYVSRVRIQHDYFRKIEQIGVQLRSDEPPVNGAFVGTVEALNGAIGSQGRREGEIILSLLIDGGPPVRARMSVSPEWYEIADKVHMHPGMFVKVIGELYPGRQPRTLANITGFELVDWT